MAWRRWELAAVMAARPAVRVDQLGSLPGRPVRATVIDPALQPLTAALLDRTGRTVGSAWSRPWRERPDPTSGLVVHVVDLPGPTVTGSGFRVRVGDHTSHPFTIGEGLHQPLARDALHVLTLLRSGCAVSDDAHPGYGRPAGHLGVAPNTGDTAVPAWSGSDAERLYPGWRCEGRFDVSGGWYDAGDYGKYATSAGIALWQLLGVLDLPPAPGARPAAVRAECRWQLDWLVRMQVPDPDPLAGTVFHRVHGTTWSPIPGWAHQDPTERVLHRPSTAATLHLAAAAAKGARLFAAEDPPVSTTSKKASSRTHR